MKKRFILIFILCIFLIPVFVEAEDYVVSNSADWKDVYSSILYANLRELNSDFLVSTPHGPVLLDGISKNYDLVIVSSKNNPLVFNYPSLARSKGFNSVEEIETSSANLDLINELPEYKKFYCCRRFLWI